MPILDASKSRKRKYSLFLHYCDRRTVRLDLNRSPWLQLRKADEHSVFKAKQTKIAESIGQDHFTCHKSEIICKMFPIFA